MPIAQPSIGQAVPGPPQTFRQTYVIQWDALHSGNSIDVPTRFPRPMQLVVVSADATNAVTRTTLADVDVFVQANGFRLRPAQSGKPDVDILPGSTIRVTASRVTQPPVPVAVLVTLALTEIS